MIIAKGLVLVFELRDMSASRLCGIAAHLLSEAAISATPLDDEAGRHCEIAVMHARQAQEAARLVEAGPLA